MPQPKSGGIETRRLKIIRFDYEDDEDLYTIGTVCENVQGILSFLVLEGLKV